MGLHAVRRRRPARRHQGIGAIGLPDSTAARDYLGGHLTMVLNSPSSIGELQHRGHAVRTVRESFLMGPRGGTRVRTVWEGESLTTINLYPGRP